MKETNETQTIRPITIVHSHPEEDNFARSMGISEKREDELNEIIKEVLLNHKKCITDDVVEISQRCDNAPELAYCMFHYGNNMGRMSVKTEMLKRMLGH